MKKKRFSRFFSFRILGRVIPLLTVFFIILSSSSFAAIIYKGTIYWVNGEPIGNYTHDVTATTVDQIYFTVNSPGDIEIDILSCEETSLGSFEDINGDGEIAWIDPYIYLFHDDGFVDPSDFIAENDDSLHTFADGSFSAYDSFLSLHLDAGDYVLAVGDYDLSLLAAVVGIISSESYGPYTSDWVVADHGDYQVTFRGDITLTTPVLSSIWLFGSGLICLLGFRRKFRKR